MKSFKVLCVVLYLSLVSTIDCKNKRTHTHDNSNSTTPVITTTLDISNSTTPDISNLTTPIITTTPDVPTSTTPDIPTSTTPIITTTPDISNSTTPLITNSTAALNTTTDFSTTTGNYSTPANVTIFSTTKPNNNEKLAGIITGSILCFLIFVIILSAIILYIIRRKSRYQNYAQFS